MRSYEIGDRLEKLNERELVPPVTALKSLCPGLEKDGV